jgi:TP901 family phage tail tape measure protein
MADNFTKVITYVGDITGVTRELGKLQAINQRIAHGLGKDFGQATKTFGDAVTGLTKSNLGDFSAKVSQDVKLLDGRFGTLTQTTRILADGSEKVTTSFKELDKSSQSAGANITRLISRAVLTIPIWLALRGAVMGAMSAFNNGIRDMIEFDRALQKVKQNLSGTPEEIASQFKVLRKEITQTALTLGVSTEEIAGAIKKFASLGFPFEEALAGGIGATKLATVLFGDASETADAFARALNLLIDRSKGAASAQQQMNELYALAAKLEKTNQFEIKEINDSLKNFAGTAKSFNLTGQQTLAILATLGTSLLEGARGGTAAATAFQQMVSHIPDVSKILGLKVNPQKMPIVDIFVQIIEAIEKLNKTDTVAATEAINKLFGGLKAAKPIRALIADLGKLRENLQMNAPLSEFDARVNDVTNTLSKQSDRFHNLNKEIGKAFISGLVGAEDFGTALKSINSALESMQQLAPKAGHALMTAITGFGTLGVGIPILAFEEEKKRVAGAIDDLQKEINKGLQGKLKTTELRNLIIKISSLELEGLGQQQKNALGKQLQKQVQTGLDESPIDVTAKVNAQVELDNEIAFAKQTKLSEILLKDVLERMKAEGALNSVLTKTEIKLREQWKIQGEWNDELEKQLEFERQINEEKKLQSQLSSDSLKLFRIAQENGVEVAKEIGDVLAGNISFDTFIRKGGEAVDIFSKEWKDLLEQQQALAFFSGERVPGLGGLRGGGRIPIDEQLGTPNLTEAQIRRNQLERKLFEGTEGLTTQKIQELQVARMAVEALKLPPGAIYEGTPSIPIAPIGFESLGNNINLINAKLQELFRTQAIIPANNAPNTRAEINRAVQTAEATYNINFNEGAFNIFGSPDKTVQDAMKKAVTDGIKDFQDKLVGKQTNVL